MAEALYPDHVVPLHVGECQRACKRCVDWSISHDLLGAAICEELPELSETDAERSTKVPLLSAAESIYPLNDADVKACKQTNKRTDKRRNDYGHPNLGTQLTVRYTTIQHTYITVSLPCMAYSSPN